MALTINQALVNETIAEELVKLCPYGAITYENRQLCIEANCKNCKMCVRVGPQGVVTWKEETEPFVNKEDWKGIAVFAERRGEQIHPVTLELIGKAKSLAKITGHPVYAVIIGSEVTETAKELLHYGVDRVYVYDASEFQNFTISPYANAFCDFIEKVKPSSVMVGATNLGRSLAPKVAARFHAGLTADCTILQMRENTDLVQIRPAFGGNIMAQIVTPNSRPQFCTVRYKVFQTPDRCEKEEGEINRMVVDACMLKSGTKVIRLEEKPKEIDISEAEAIIAAGRGIKNQKDMSMVKELAELLHAQLAGTRPLVEKGWLSPKRQIGLSGRTVKPRLIVTVGVSGAIQFAAGMKNSECIFAINNDRNAEIFHVAHYGLIGDLYDIVPRLIEKIKGQEGETCIKELMKWT
jgi:electron transfer flavoprotein alpha subunit